MENESNIATQEELLLKNKEILNSLILENFHRKEKSLCSYKELEYIKSFEDNLIKLLETCPKEIIQRITKESNFSDKFN